MNLLTIEMSVTNETDEMSVIIDNTALKTLYKNSIDYFIEEIQTGNLIKINEAYVLEKLTTIIESDNSTLEFTNLYENAISRLEFYNTMYNDKMNDLCNFIIENMNDKEKQMLLKDDEGKYILIVKPLLERSYPVNISFQENELYKLIVSIEHNMKKILHYENTFLYNKDDNATLL